MKISPQKYAKALFIALKGKNQAESLKIIDNFIETLSSHHQLGIARKIIYYLESLYQKEGLVWPVLFKSAHKLSKNSKEEILKYLKNKAKGVELDWQEELEPDLLGGFVLRYKDKIFDASLKTRLLEFNKQIKKN